MTTIIQLFGFSVAVSNLSEMTRQLVGCFGRRAPSFKPRIVAPISMNDVMSARQLPEVAAALQSFEFLTMDGMPLVWLARLLGFKQAERVYGPDLMVSLLAATAKTSIRHYFYGGTEVSLQNLIAAITTQWPKLKVAGQWAPPFHDLNIKEEREMVRRLKTAQADVIWVGLGSWKQILWAYRYQAHLKVRLIILVGAAFDFLGGTKPQAPGWMQRLGLEWLFRLCQEPARLWRRYILQIPGFVMLSVQELGKFYWQRAWKNGQN